MEDQTSTDSEEKIGESTPQTPPKKKIKTNIYVKPRIQKFRQEWLQNEDYKYWLIPVPDKKNKAKCTFCDTEFLATLTVIKNHKNGKLHKKNERCKKSTDHKVLDTFLKNEDDISVKTKEAEIKICAFLVEHNISFLAADHLTEVLKSCFPDSKICQNMSMKRTKAHAITINVMGRFEKEKLIETLKSTKFSVLVDETTDIATNKTLCIIVRYFDKEENKITSKFFELLNVVTKDHTKSDAGHLFDLIKKCFLDKNIPLNNIIGLACDGCNLMVGANNSVASRFIEECPGIKIMKCICHSIHLCCSEACKTLPRSCEDLARNIYNFFKNSSKRLAELEQFQEFADVEIHRILHPSQTRWLSLGQVVCRIVEQWTALQLFFNEKWLQQRLLATEQVCNCLNDPFMKLYYYFLEWILPKINSLNELFQSEKVLIPTLHETVCRCYTDILLCFMTRKYVLSLDISKINPLDRSNYVEKSNLYLGIKVMNMISNQEITDSREKLNYFYDQCYTFLSTLCCEIKKRYDFEDNFFSDMYIFIPKNSISHKTRERHPTLLPLLQKFNRFAPETEWQNIDDEWRNLPNFVLPDNIKTTDEPDKFWGNLLSLNIFSSLCNFVINLFSLPHSNAECERAFSKINLIKTKVRNRLTTATINGTMLASQLIKKTTCQKFTPPRELLKMFNAEMYAFKNKTEKKGDIDVFIEFDD